MAWQDELRRLDEELAAGRLSAEEYRQLRDALLASQGRAGQGADAPPAEQPGAEQPAASPFPPPFKWESSDSTQVMRPATGQPDATSDTTQVVPGQQGRQAQQGEDAERTQVVPHSASQPRPPQQQQGQPPPMQQGPPLGYSAPAWQQVGDQGQHAPPWAGSDLPPIGQEPTWLRQGPEVFDPGQKSSTGIILAIVAVVLVVLLGAGAVYWFGIRGDGSDPPVATTTTQQTPTTTTVPKPDGPFVELDGQILINDTYTMADAAKVNRPSKTEIQPLTDAGTETVTGYVTESDEIRTGIWTFTPKSGVAAQALLEAIDQLYRNAKYQELAGAATGVRARYLAGAQDGSTPTVYRAHYLHDGVVVRVEAYGGGPDAVERKFTELLGRQLDDYPVS